MTFECEVCGREFETERGVSVHKAAAHSAEDKPYTDPATLRRLYWGQSLSMREVAAELGTDVDRVDYWMDVHNIETRRSYAKQNFASLRVDQDGYTLWREYHNGDYNRVPVHRLTAVAVHGFDDVASNDVHHKNGLRWDNRPANLEVLDPSEHRRIHGEEQADEQRELMQQLRSEGRLKRGDVA